MPSFFATGLIVTSALLVATVFLRLAVNGDRHEPIRLIILELDYLMALSEYPFSRSAQRRWNQTIKRWSRLCARSGSAGRNTSVDGLTGGLLVLELNGRVVDVKV